MIAHGQLVWAAALAAVIGLGAARGDEPAVADAAVWQNTALMIARGRSTFRFDNFGNEEFNVKLSQQRADAVRDLLVARGIAAQRIRTKGYGPKFPVVENDTAAGRQQNRRVEVVVLNEGATADGSTR